MSKDDSQTGQRTPVTNAEDGRRHDGRKPLAGAELFRFMVESVTHYSIFATDTEGRIVSWNAGAERVFGYAGSEITGQRAHILFTPEDVESGAPERELDTARARGWAEDERWHVRRDGTRFWASGIVTPLKDEAGAVQGFVKVARDMTGRKRSEQRLVTLYSVAQMLAESVTFDEAVPNILGDICRRLGWEVGTLWGIDYAAGRLRCVDVWHSQSVEVTEFEAATRARAFTPGEGLPGQVWLNKETCWIIDITVKNTFPRAQIAAREGLRGAVAFPLLLGSEVVGVMEFFSRDVRQPDQELLDMMSAIGNQLGLLMDRKRAEEALRQSEESFRTLAETASDAIITINETSTILFANPGTEKIFGYAIEELTGQPLTMLMPDYLRHLHNDGFGRYLETGRRHISWNGVELPGLHKGGHEIPLEVSFGEFRKDGRHFFTGIIRDITERKRVEARNHFLVHLDDAVRPLADAEQIVAASARLLGEHLGVDRCAYAEVEADEDHFRITGDYTTEGMPNIVGRFSMSQFGTEALRLMRANEPYVVANVETDPRVNESDAAAYRQTHIRAVVSVPLHKGGRFVAGMAVHQKTPRQWSSEEIELVTSVTNRCWESIERARVVRSLRASEERYRSLVSVLTSVVWSADAEGRFVTPQPLWESYTGQAWEQYRDFGWGAAIHADDRANVLASWEAAKAARDVYRATGRLWHASGGEYRWFQASAVPLLNRHGAVREWIGTVTDVHDQRQAGDERERLLREAQEANRLKDEFLATVSHELRTPMTAIVGWLFLMRTGHLDEQTYVGALETIERNARSQTQLIDDLLDVSRIITGKLRLDVRHVDPGSVIVAAADAVRPAAEAKNIRLQTLLDPSAGPISGDPDRLQQVIWNLLSNAIKFTPKGGRVQVRLERVNSHVEIIVSDTGNGITPEFLPHVFDRFRQADMTSTRAHGGLGLGLAIVRQIVEMHGGTVRVSSPGEGHGAVFTVDLPLLPLRSASPDSVGRVHPTAITGTTPDCPPELDGLKILLVDDEPDTLRMLDMVLTNCGGRVTATSSVADALDAIDREQPDVIVSDIGMPGEDGYSLIQKVRSLPEKRGGRIPAAALTAYAREEDRIRVLRAGFQMHVPKPVNLTELVTVVKSLAERIKT